jgi:hypothetical protein
LDAGNSTFRYVHRVRFELRDPFASRPREASDVAAWLYGAAERGIDRFWLRAPTPGDANLTDEGIPDRVLAAFAGGGRWQLCGTSREQIVEIWSPSWTIRNQGEPDQRIWEVDYHREPQDATASRPRPDLTVAAARLSTVLERAELFARGEDLADWADWFSTARALGDVEDPKPPYHPDLFPARGYPRPARRLLATAARAWVFGGMGSWNDLVFGTSHAEREYDQLSAELYAAVLDAFAASVNAELEA